MLSRFIRIGRRFTLTLNTPNIAFPFSATGRSTAGLTLQRGFCTNLNGGQSGNASSSSTPMSEAKDEHSQCRLQSQQKEKIVIDYNDAESFWETLDSLLNVANYSNNLKREINENNCGLHFYTNLTSNPYELDFYNRDDQINEFRQEIKRKYQICHCGTLQKNNREAIMMTFGSPGSGKSRLIDEYAQYLNNNKHELNVNPICLSICYNGWSITTQYDLSENRKIARSAFCWRLISCLYKGLQQQHDLQRNICGQIQNFDELGLNQAISLIFNHPSLIDIDNKCVFIGIDEILEINQRLTDEHYSVAGRLYPLYNVYNIIREIGAYYDTFLYHQKPFIHFMISCLYKAGFNDPFTDEIPRRSFNIIKLPPLSIVDCLDIILKHCGQEYYEWLKIYDIPIRFCSGSPLLIHSLIKYLKNEPYSETAKNRIVQQLYTLIVNDTENRIKFDIYSDAFKTDKDFFNFLATKLDQNVSTTQQLSITDINKLYKPTTKKNHDIRQLLFTGSIQIVDQKFTLSPLALYHLANSKSSKLSSNLKELIIEFFNLLYITDRVKYSEYLFLFYHVIHSQILLSIYGDKPMTVSQFLGKNVNFIVKQSNDNKTTPLFNCNSFPIPFYQLL